MAALTKKVGEIPLSLQGIAARDAEMMQEPISGPGAESTTVE